MSLPPSLQAQARQQLRAGQLSKTLSQVFLTDPTALAAIAEACQLSAQDAVVEIGCGSGFLTQALLPYISQGQFLGIEPDSRKHAGLQALLAIQPPTLQYQLSDQSVLDVDLAQALPDNSQLTKNQLTFVGNLPYHLSSAILFYCCGELDDHQHPLRQRSRRLVFMLQREVAQRVTAQPGTKAYGMLSIALQTWFDTQYVLTVPRQAFVPVPKVDSGVVYLIPRETPRVAVALLPKMRTLVHGVFQHRRKTLRNGLKCMGLNSWDAIDPDWLDRRPETLSIEEFGQLAQQLSE